jgi:hypothetical protein
MHALTRQMFVFLCPVMLQKYSRDVLCGDLDKTPVHKPPGFWDRNASRLLDKDMKVKIWRL